MNRSKKLVEMALLHNEKDKAASSESSQSNSSNTELCIFKNIAEHQSTSHVSPSPHDLSSNESSLCSVSSSLEKLFSSDDSLFDNNYEPPLNNATDSEAIPEEKQLNKSTQKCSRQKNKSLRVLGKHYAGYKSDNGCHPPPRLLKLKTCNHTKTVGKSKRSYMCGEINEDTRKTIFQHFWSMNSWGSKKAYLKGLVEFRTPKRRRKDTKLSNLKKCYVYDCYMPKSDGAKVRVCRSFFLCTLDIKKDSFCRWIKENNVSAHKNLNPDLAIQIPTNQNII